MFRQKMTALQDAIKQHEISFKPDEWIDSHGKPWPAAFLAVGREEGALFYDEILTDLAKLLGMTRQEYIDNLKPGRNLVRQRILAFDTSTLPKQE